MDNLDIRKRSWNMSRIGQRNTKPEIIVRKYLRSVGRRYRLGYNVKGRPDIVFPSEKVAVFVNGCFWHTHKGCSESHIPKTNTHYWIKKFRENSKRDKRTLSELTENGWKVFVFYECELEKNKESTIFPLLKYLDKKLN